MLGDAAEEQFVEHAFAVFAHHDQVAVRFLLLLDDVRWRKALLHDKPSLVGRQSGLRTQAEAAKEASDMVLADDNFATIATAVREGRAVNDNLKKFILFMLPTNGGEALVVIAAILFELPLPLTPAQVLWINMVTSSTLGLALAFEPAEGDIMNAARGRRAERCCPAS